MSHPPHHIPHLLPPANFEGLHKMFEDVLEHSPRLRGTRHLYAEFGSENLPKIYYK